MRILLVVLGFLLRQAIPQLQEKVYDLKFNIEWELKKFYLRFLGSMASLLIFCSTASAFIVKLGESLDNNEGFFWTASLSLYLGAAVLSLICLLFFIKTYRLKKMSHDLTEGKNYLEDQLANLAQILENEKPKKNYKKKGVKYDQD